MKEAKSIVCTTQFGTFHLFTRIKQSGVDKQRKTKYLILFYSIFPETKLHCVPALMLYILLKVNKISLQVNWLNAVNIATQ